MSDERILQSVVFLPLSAQTADPETIAWCRGVPMLVAEELQAGKQARSCFAAWTTGQDANMRLAHLKAAPPKGHVAAYARAARCRQGVSGWGSWFGDPFMRWLVVPANGSGARKVAVETQGGASRIEVVRHAFETVQRVLGLRSTHPPRVLSATESDDALLAWLQDLVSTWHRHRQGLAGASDADYRYLLSALSHDPGFEPAAIRVLRRAGKALAGGPGPNDDTARSVDALSTLVRLRPLDHPAQTLLGMLQRSAGDDVEAARSLRRALKADGEYAPAHRELGTLLMDQRDLRKAGAHLRRCAKITPRDPEAHFALGTLYLELRDRKRAISHLRTVLQLAPGTDTARTSARLLRDVDEGPVRTATNALGSVVPDKRTRDRDLISRTFGMPIGLDDDDHTSPPDDFLDRLDDEKSGWNG